MASYRIHRLKDHLRQSFRSAPHVSGAASVKPRDYEPADALNADSIDADSPYAAFFAARDSGVPLEVGDLLEAADGTLRICKFVGFEEAHWIVPETKADGAANPAHGQVEPILEAATPE
jgi:hypothetical protein